MFTAFVILLSQREWGGLIKEKILLLVCHVNLPLGIRGFFLCQNKPIWQCVEEQHEPYNNCFGENSIAPVLVHLTPKVAWRMPVKCSKDNTGEN